MPRLVGGVSHQIGGNVQPLKMGGCMARIFIKMTNLVLRTFEHVSVILVAVLAILLMYEVFMRFVLNSPVDWVLDISQLLQAALAFLSAAYVLKVGGHVNMNLLTEFVSKSWKKKLAISSNSLAAFGCAWMAYLTWDLFSKSLMIKEAMYSIDLPLYPFKILVPLCFASLSLQSLVQLWEAIQTAPEKFDVHAEEGGL
jgi:TRAP-type C4-dicarboxylate transport system permease small subunit